MSKKISLITAIAFTAQSLFSNAGHADSVSSAAPSAFTIESANACLAKLKTPDSSDDLYDRAAVNNLGCELEKSSNTCALYANEGDKLVEDLPSLTIADDQIRLQFLDSSGRFVDTEVDLSGDIRRIDIITPGHVERFHDPQKVDILAPKDRNFISEWIRFGLTKGCLTPTS